MSANRFVVAACGLALGLTMLSASADVVVGGSAMFPQKNIVENAVNSKDHTTLVAAVKAAGEQGSIHGIRAGQCGVFGAARRHGRNTAQARKQG
jgi:hypothetical protein